MKQFQSSAKIHVFICVNEREKKEGVKPSCSPSISTESFREIKQWILDEKLMKDVYCNRTHCLGFCNNSGGVMVIYPSGKYYIGLKDVSEIKQIILDELKLIN